MLKKIPYATSADILARFDLKEPAQALVSPDMAPEEVISALSTVDTFIDLIGFFGHALPAREGVCWALSAVERRRPPEKDLEREAVDAVRRWVRDPQERDRQLCRGLAEEIGTDSPFGWLCLATDWNGSGSIVAPDQPEVLPAPFLHAKALLGAVGLLAPSDKDAMAGYVEEVAAIGLDVSRGEWPCLRQEDTTS